MAMLPCGQSLQAGEHDLAQLLSLNSILDRVGDKLGDEAFVKSHSLAAVAGRVVGDFVKGHCGPPWLGQKEDATFYLSKGCVSQ